MTIQGLTWCKIYTEYHLIKGPLHSEVRTGVSMGCTWEELECMLRTPCDSRWPDRALEGMTNGSLTLEQVEFVPSLLIFQKT